MARPKKKEENKKKKISFTINPDVYDLWIKYCEENDIDNQSEFIEKIIKEDNKREF